MGMGGAVEVERWEELEINRLPSLGNPSRSLPPHPTKPGPHRPLDSESQQPRQLILPDRAAWRGCSLPGEEASRAPGCRVSRPPPEYARP